MLADRILLFSYYNEDASPEGWIETLLTSKIFKCFAFKPEADRSDAGAYVAVYEKMSIAWPHFDLLITFATTHQARNREREVLRLRKLLYRKMNPDDQAILEVKHHFDARTKLRFHGSSEFLKRVGLIAYWIWKVFRGLKVDGELVSDFLRIERESLHRDARLDFATCLGIDFARYRLRMVDRAQHEEILDTVV